jgi:hypothetical protein
MRAKLNDIQLRKLNFSHASEDCELGFATVFVVSNKLFNFRLQHKIIAEV